MPIKRKAAEKKHKPRVVVLVEHEPDEIARLSLWQRIKNRLLPLSRRWARFFRSAELPEESWEEHMAIEGEDLVPKKELRAKYWQKKKSGGITFGESYADSRKKRRVKETEDLDVEKFEEGVFR